MNSMLVGEAGPRSSSKRFHWVIWVVVVIIFTALTASSVYFFLQYRHYRALSARQAVQPNRTQAAELVTKIGKFMELPVGEEPTIATVTDPEALKLQPFFAHAKSGDILLMYVKTGKAILFRQSTEKIIEVAPISLNQASPSATTTSATPVPTTIISR